MNGSVVLRKAGVIAHVTVSVGWFGAVAAFLAVAVEGLRVTDRDAVVAAYLAMRWIAWLAIVPFCVASLVTGIVQSLGTPWGLFKHYWVVAKLLLTVVATALLLLHTNVIDYAADVALHVPAGVDFGRLRVQLVVDAAAGLAALLVTTVLAVYKPRGLTAYGRRTAGRTGSILIDPESPAP
jgi:hypothetical protein